MINDNNVTIELYIFYIKNKRKINFLQECR